MAVQLVLVLISVFFTEGLALQCQECVPYSSQTCFSQECPYECSSSTIAANLGGIQVEHNVQTCLMSVFCVKGSVNTGFLKATINSKCCRTDNCNDQAVPVLLKQSPNGKKCCTNSDCSETVNCEGDEDHCINGTVVPPVFKVSLKGCATKSICDGLVSIRQQFNETVDVKCCEGNLCNGLCEGNLCNGLCEGNLCNGLCEGNLCNGLSNIAMSINLLVTLGSLLCSILFL